MSRTPRPGTHYSVRTEHRPIGPDAWLACSLLFDPCEEERMMMFPERLVDESGKAGYLLLWLLGVPLPLLVVLYLVFH
jgi:hypothetical protein